MAIFALGMHMQSSSRLDIKTKMHRQSRDCARPWPCTKLDANMTLTSAATLSWEPTTRTGLPQERIALAGQIVAKRYRFLKRLGRGGMSEVYAAVDLRSGKKIAVKLLTRNEEDSRRRFVHEYRVLAELDHKHLVKAHDFGKTASGEPFYTLELLDGYSLNYWFDVDRRVAPARVARIGVQVCRALAELHRLHVIHRDVKPSNIILVAGSDEHVKLIDLGIAKLQTGYYRAHRDATSTARRLVTPALCIPCTPSYAAPEVGLEPPHPRQDIFSLGVVLFRLLTGKMVKSCDLQQLDEQLASIPEPLAQALEPAICEEPSERYQDVGEFEAALVDALSDLLSPPPLAPLSTRARKVSHKPAPGGRRARWSTVLRVGGVAGLVAGVVVSVVMSFVLLGRQESLRPATGGRDHAAVFPAPQPAQLDTTRTATSTPLSKHDELENALPVNPEVRADVPPVETAPTNNRQTDFAGRGVDLPEPSASPTAKRESRARPRRRKAKPPHEFRPAMAALEPRLRACLSLTGHSSTTITVRVRRGRAKLVADVDLPTYATMCLKRAAAKLEFGEASFTATYKVNP